MKGFLNYEVEYSVSRIFDCIFFALKIAELNLIRKLIQRVKTLRSTKDFDILECFNEIDVFGSGAIDEHNLKKFFSDNSKAVNSDPSIMQAILERVGGLNELIDISDFYRIFDIFKFNQNSQFFSLKSIDKGESSRNQQYLNW